MTGGTKVLTAAAVAAGIVWALSRTNKGEAVAVDALEAVISGGQAAVDALMPRGIRNNNPGNLAYLPPARAWKGQVGRDGPHGVYDTAANGVRAIGKQLLAYEKRGLNTPRKIATTWSATDQAAYVAALAKGLNVDADSPIPVDERLPQLAGVIIRQENGVVPYTEREISNWVNLA